MKSTWYWSAPQGSGYSIEECEEIIMQDKREIKKRVLLLNARLRHHA